MRTRVYSLRDRKAAVFGRPVFTASFGSLVRELTDAVREGQDMLGKHPGDFELYELGWFDDEKGTFDLLKLPDLVLQCGSLVAVSAGDIREADAAPEGAVAGLVRVA